MKNTDTTSLSDMEREDQDLIDSLEKGEWVPVSATERKRTQHMLGLFPRKDARINVRLSTPDLTALQLRAAREGMPYQTLLASIVHRYVTGQLHDIFV